MNIKGKEGKYCMNDRKVEIVDLVNQHGQVTFKEIKDLFPNLSAMTVRRDLEELDREHALVRVHGGARSIGTIVGSEDLFRNRAVSYMEEKGTIAQKALPYITPGYTMFFDSGSTVAELARILPDEQMIIFTGNISAALEMAHLKKPVIHMIGGRLDVQSLCVSDSCSLDMLNDVNINYAFFGVTGYSERRGFTCGKEEEYRLKKMVIDKSDKVIVLMDSSKVGISSVYTYAMEEDVDMVISDSKLPPELLERFGQNSVEVL